MPVPADNPPKSSPWQDYATPELLDGVVQEIVDSENVPRQFQNLAPGTPYPDPKKFAGYFFLKAVALSHNRVQFWWSLGAFQNQDLYNYDIDFVSDSADHPVYVRRYLTRRDVQASGGATVARNTPFTGIFSIYVTNGGTGYDPENPPTVTVDGNATAVALVTKAGIVQWVRITSEGSGYAAAPNVTIAAPSAGVQATATAFIQSATTVLVKQRWQQLPVDDPRYPLFLLETRIYQTFPGPVLTAWDFVPRIFKYAKTERQLVLASTVPADNNDSTPAYDNGVTVEYQPLTTVYSAKLTTTLPVDGFVWNEETGDATDIVYQAFVNWRFPDQVLNDPVVEMLIAADSGGRFDFDFAWDIMVEEGYAGPCVAEVRERYTYDPNDAAFVAALPAPTLVKPEAESVYTGVIYNGTPPIARFYTFAVPMSLHPQLNITIQVNGDTPLPADADTFSKDIIEATEPPAFATGDPLVIVEQPERLGIGGLWMVRIITLTHP